MKQSKPNLIKEAASSVRLDGETFDEGDKPEDTERLGVAREILYEKRSQVCFKTGKEEQDHNENRVCAILSRRDALMKKRGAVEGLRKFEFSMAGEYGEWWTKTDAPRHIRETIKELEREIREMEGK
mgnify:CR=1 FL=1